ncbi:MAG: response regulator [Planctomycetaceae bacterium]|jgi:signal transduction histidine kinase/ActR/RegA family two-component response regulator|nr:response regulator [Planctomycetaceae bacterium]
MQTRLLLSIGVPSVTLFALILYFSYRSDLFNEKQHLKTIQVAEVTDRAKNLDLTLNSLARAPAAAAQIANNRPIQSVDEMVSVQKYMLDSYPAIYGTTFAWEPNVFDAKMEHCAPYVWRDLKTPNKLDVMMFNPENNYDYLDKKPEHAWYWQTKQVFPKTEPQMTMGGMTIVPSSWGLWSEPYFDEGGGDVLMCTFSAPFFKEGRFAGCVTCDIATSGFHTALSESKIPGGYFVLLAAGNVVISHPREELALNLFREHKSFADTIVPQDQNIWDPVLFDLNAVLQSFKTKQMVQAEDRSEKYLPQFSQTLHFGKSDAVTIEVCQLASTGWILLYIVPQRESLAKLNSKTVRMSEVFVIGFIVISLFFVRQISYQIIRPIKQLVAATKTISRGFYDQRLVLGGNTCSELRIVYQNFNMMMESIKRNISVAIQNASAREAADLANRTKSELLMVVSHELRTPLNGIIGTTELLLQDETLPPKVRNYVELQRESGGALMQLINNIVVYSAGEYGGIAVEDRKFELRTLVDSVVESCTYQAKRLSVGIITEIEQSLPQYVFGDDKHLQQVLHNVLSNAVKFSNRSDVRFRVFQDTSVGALLPPEEESSRKIQWICFEIIDKGIGMSNEHLEKIFSKKTIGDVSSNRMFDGLSIGLAVSQQIVQSLRGTIGASSLPGKGTTIFVSVPLPPVVMDAGETEIQDLKQGIKDATVILSGSSAVRRAKLSILIAEDNRINKIVINELLTSKGFDTTVVDNGQEAVEEYERRYYDLILMDCQMPGMDGYEATLRIRTMELDKRVAQPIPIIALTANAAPGDKERCLSIGMNAYCNKPINAVELISLIHQLLPAVSTKHNSMVTKVK